MADVDLPAGTVSVVTGSSNEEDWRYNAPYDDVVAFLRSQFATGPKYADGKATWWRNLPPCYNDHYDYTNNRQDDKAPPEGWVSDSHGGSTRWMWADGVMSLDVQVFRPGGSIAPNGEPWIVIYYMPDEPTGCRRN